MIQKFFRLTNVKQKVTPIKILHEYVMMFDGASKGNPGPSGAGAIIYYNNTEVSSKGIFLGNNETNNVAEYHGLLLGLQQAIELNIKKITICGDSQLIIKQMNGEYCVKSSNLIPLYTNAKRLSKSFDEIQYIHVLREKNVRADELANEFIHHF